MKWKQAFTRRRSPARVTRQTAPKDLAIGEFAEARCPNWRNGRNGKYVNSYCTSAAPEVEP